MNGATSPGLWPSVTFTAPTINLWPSSRAWGFYQDETAMAVLDDEESTKKSQRRCRRREEIHRGSAVLVMAQK